MMRLLGHGRSALFLQSRLLFSIQTYARLGDLQHAYQAYIAMLMNFERSVRMFRRYYIV